MEVSKIQPLRMSRWSSLFFSLLMALILTTFAAQVFSADGLQSEGDPTVPPVGESDDQSGSEGGVSQSGELTATVALTPTAVLTTTVGLTTTVQITPTDSYTSYLPLMFRPLVLSVVKPNSNNQWQIYWPDFGNGATYQVQESHDPGFGSLVSDQTISQASINFQHDPSPYSSYYYRVRIIKGNLTSRWAYAQVRGAYLDNFDDPNTGWTQRRTTYLEKTGVKYGTDNEAGMLIAVVGDRFDWVLGSPMVEAPDVPYVIEYRARVHEPSNLISGGSISGGDWNGEACPEIGNVYGTDNCFNHFYTFNFIYHPQLTLLFERVDKLLWCPGCGGSQVKRLGDIGNTWPAFEVLDANSAKGWHDYRVEVRGDGLHLSIDGNFVRTFNDTTYINEPYFGVFASTYEYEPSIWLYEYYKVTPLD